MGKYLKIWYRQPEAIACGCYVRLKNNVEPITFIYPLNQILQDKIDRATA